VTKKILIISNESRIGGAEMSMLSLLGGLPADKYSIVVALPGKGPLYDRIAGHYPIVSFPMKKLSRGINLFRKVRSLGGVVNTGARMAAFARRESVDVIYANGIQAQLYGMMVRLFSGKRTIWHVRDRVRDVLISFCCAFASSRIICISKYIYDQTPGSRRKKRLVYNGLDTGVWTPAPGRPGIPGVPPLSEGTPIVGQVGQLIPWKRHRDFILAAAMVIRHLPRVHFVILGEDMTGDYQDYVAELKQLVRSEGLDSHFSFTGFIGEIQACINQLDVLVHCAEGEPFGRALLEGMALEKPVIAYRSGACAEIIEDGESGVLVEPGRVDALAAAILALLGDDVKRAAMGKRARQRVIGQFELRDTISRVREVIDER
jgi:glycosyltransferase involved in cell wall biosynthesis